MKYYTSGQVYKLLNEILQQIPVNDNRLIKLRKFVENKSINVHEHL